MAWIQAVNLISGRVIHRIRKVETEINGDTRYRQCSGVGQIGHETAVCMAAKYLRDLWVASQYSSELLDDVAAAKLQWFTGGQYFEWRVVHE